jgi:outer membrane lipoprotein-sorting protein
MLTPQARRRGMHTDGSGRALVPRCPLPAGIVAACVTLLITSGGLARAAGGTPQANEILRRALDLSEGIRDYTARISIRADLQGAPAEMPPFKVYFKRPDKVHIESRSIVVMRKDMLTFGNLSKVVDEGADILLLGTKVVDGTPMHTVKLVPKRPDAGNQRARRMLVTIDGRRWTVRRIEMFAGTEQQAVMFWSYVLVGGRYWMPQTIRLAIPRAPKRDGEPGAELVVTFSDYTVNSGLSDSLFEEPAG